jgi:hypothetical protein
MSRVLVMQLLEGEEMFGGEKSLDMRISMILLARPALDPGGMMFLFPGIVLGFLAEDPRLIRGQGIPGHLARGA